jgi:signal transduction histidine kinase
MIRSLRWRLVLAAALIITAVAVAAGLFSSFTVKREFDRFLVTQRRAEVGRALELFEQGGRQNLEQTMQRVHRELGFRSLVAADGSVLARYPPELGQYEVVIVHDSLRLTRRHEGAAEALVLKGMNHNVPGLGTVWLLPPPGPGPGAGKFRVSVDRWLLTGLAVAALLAVLVLLTIARRVFAPVEALTRGARALAGGRLDTRVDVRGNDEIGELARAFNGMADALERNERARRNMVSDVAHELRTPLTNIRVQLEAVEDGVIEPDAKFLASMSEDAATLSRLIEDLQQLSLAEAGQLRLEVDEIGVDALVARALDGLERRIEERGLAVTTEVDATPVRVDPRRIVQVLRNLMVNSLTFARSSLAISSRIDDGQVEVRVADDGPGVPPEHADRIFDRFYRADAARSRTTGGAGLGLAIARQLVELHGGTIALENRPGEGATFVFRIPRA